MTFNDQRCAEHLAGMVRFETLSRPVTAEMDFAPFFAFHTYLEQTYPLLHKTLRRESVGPAGLLYCWKGTGESGHAPLLLAAHQDVVPVGDLERWEHPPFAGVIKDGWLYGRGANDDKSVIMSHMEAIEALIEEGFRPAYDVYLAYGYNEEVGGGDDSSAGRICAVLAERGVRLGCVIDEGAGPGLVPGSGIDVPVVNILLGEKGYADFEISISDVGGHSAYPGKRSILAELGQVAVDLHAARFPYRLTDTIRAEFAARAEKMTDKAQAALYADMDKNFQALLPLIDAKPHTASKFHTTMAMTMAGASSQANVLPAKAYIVVNCRIMEGDSLAGVQAHIESVVAGRAEVRLLTGNEPSPISRIDSHAYRSVSRAYREMHSDVLVVPGIISGGTDAKYYYPICDSVYRCGGCPGGYDARVHNYNERIKVEGIGEGPEFFARLLKKYQEA